MSGLPTDDKNRKALPLWTFLMEYFPDVFVEVCRMAVVCNDQHNPGQRLHWARDKSKDQMNTAFRHMFDYGRGVHIDTDGTYHLAKAIWRLSAQLQLDIEASRTPLEKSLVELKAPEVTKVERVRIPGCMSSECEIRNLCTGSSQCPRRVSL